MDARQTPAGMDSAWRRAAQISATVSLALLLAEHFLPHGLDLNPVDHWLSEYALSHSSIARGSMIFTFAALAATAFSVSMISRWWVQRGFFLLSSVALAAMMFFNTDPNDGRIFRILLPPTPGNWHQIALYVAIGATLLGMAAAELRGDRGSRSDGWKRQSLLGVAVVATGIQTGLVAWSVSERTMTRYGGITERIVVSATLAWVLLFSLES